MGIFLGPATPNAARPGRFGLDEDLARLKMRLLLQRILLRLLATAGLDTRPARDRLQRTADNLACLRYRQQPIPRT